MARTDQEDVDSSAVFVFFDGVVYDCLVLPLLLSLRTTYVH